MYNFNDTTKRQTDIINLPSEAMQINGGYIEELVPGYTTLSVAGREVLSSEIDDFEVGRTNGTVYQSKRYESRVITVRYQLVAETNSAFRNSFNKLNSVLDQEQAKLIFNDESDKYFIGTKESMSSVPPGVNKVVGEFDMLCTDPFKYSNEVFEATPTIDNGTTFVVDYDGTAPSFPIFEADHTSSENGFVAFTDQDRNILQFGNPEELDKEQYQRNETLVDTRKFNDWAPYTGVNPENEYKLTNGTLVERDISNPNYLHLRNCLAIGNGGSGGGWHGGARIFTLPKDSNGETGAQNFYFYFNAFFASWDPGESGAFNIMCLTSDNRYICGYIVEKQSPTSVTAYAHMSAFNGRSDNTGKIFKTLEFPCKDGAKMNQFEGIRGNCDIIKEGPKISMYWHGSRYSYTNSVLNDMKCAKILVYIAQVGNRNTTNQFLERCYLRQATFQKMKVNKWKDIPNKFPQGTNLVIDTGTGVATNNGIIQPGLGAIGNAWEKFYLKPGINQIKCLHSTWATKPKFKVKYRKVYL